MVNYSDIILNFKERTLLFLIGFCKSSRLFYEYVSKSPLCRFNIVRLNDSDERNVDGIPIPDGTYSLTDFGKRYKIYLRRERFYRYLTPITVSAITTTVLYILEHWLLPGAVSWLLDLF